MFVFLQLGALASRGRDANREILWIGCAGGPQTVKTRSSSSPQMAFSTVLLPQDTAWTFPSELVN